MKRKIIYAGFTVLLLLITLLVTGCPKSAPTTSTTPPATSPPPTATTTPPPTTPEPTPVTLQEMAEAVADGVGEVMSIIEEDLEKVVFVFEEVHNSILGQVEIAIMLNRLYEDYGLRHVGLEGYTADNAPLDLAWAYHEPYFQAGDLITNREDVILQRLADGEISDAEVLGLLYHDAVIHGIDDPVLYAYDLPAAAQSAVKLYIYNIAIRRMDETLFNAWQALYEQEEYDEAFDFAMSVDDDAAAMWARWNDLDVVIQESEVPDFVDTIKAEAAEVGLDMGAEIEANLDTLRAYYADYVIPRSEAVAANMLALVDAYPGDLLAMIIGASHTDRVVELLTGAGVSVAVLRAVSQPSALAAGMLSGEAFERKAQGLSVAVEGQLGAILDGRRKPPPVTAQEWFQLQENVLWVLQNIAEEAYDNYEMDALALEAYLNATWESSETREDFEAGGIAGLRVYSVVKTAGAINIFFRIQLVNGKTLDGVIWVDRDGGKDSVRVENRLLEYRDDLEEQSEPAGQTQPGGSPGYQQVCSNTQVGWYPWSEPSEATAPVIPD